MASGVPPSGVLSDVTFSSHLPQQAEGSGLNCKPTSDSTFAKWLLAAKLVILWKIWQSELSFKWTAQSSRLVSVVTNPTSIHEDWGSIPGLTQWVKDSALP